MRSEIGDVRVHLFITFITGWRVMACQCANTVAFYLQWLVSSVLLILLNTVETQFNPDNSHYHKASRRLRQHCLCNTFHGPNGPKASIRLHIHLKAR